MFIREKRIGGYSYLYLVETVRENGKTKQRIIRNLGRKEVVEAAGILDRLARSAARLSQRSMILSLMADGAAPDLACRRIGAPLLFERLWQESGCRGVLEALLAGRRFEFAVERAVFLTVLHRLMVSGSDRACEHWRDDYRIEGVDALQLHHLYRAMAWLGEELPQSEQEGRTLAPRCIKDLVEEQLFARRRDLFSELSVVFMDTTTLYFEGRGGATLGQTGHSKDYRPHLNQMVVGIIMDQNGRPVCSEMWPGSTADVTTLIPTIDRLRRRFAIGRVCVVADRGMISEATIAGLEQRELEYILGVRERSSKEVYEVVLADPKPSVPLVIPRGRRPGTELEAKNVWVGNRRYVVCRNLNEAKRDAEVRAAVLRSLRERLRGGDKSLVGNSAYRRYLKTRTTSTSRSTRSGLARTRDMTVSMFCVPTCASMRSPSCCGIASCSRWRTFSGPPNRSSTPGQSITKPTKPFVATCSAPSWRSFCAKRWRIALRPRARRRNGQRYGVNSTACRRSRPSRRASALFCGRRSPAMSDGFSGPSASRCRRTSARPRRRPIIDNAPPAAKNVVLRIAHVPITV
jgi:hypothetical protein